MGARVADPIDLAEFYTLISGIPIVGRGDDVVQIGCEPPHCLLLRHAPPNSVSILQGLNGTSSVGEILRRHSADQAVWSDVLTALRDAELLVPAADWSFPGVASGPFLAPERDSLVHRHGIAVARRALQARQDAVVVVRGSGRVASAVATALAASGLGHVHQRPDRALRQADLPEFQMPIPTNGSASRASAPGGSRDRLVTQRRGRSARHLSDAAGTVGAPTSADALLLAKNIRRVAPGISVHPPAAHHRVALVVLAGDGPPALASAGELTDERIPHLAVRAGLTTAVVGPFVLPGRSSCLVCAMRHRADLDDGRFAFDAGLRSELLVPPTQLVYAATTLAVADALDHVDGVAVPKTVDGTVEWRLGELAPRRRSWAVHPDCGCCGEPKTLSTI